MEIEKVILKNLIRDETYTMKVLPFLKDEYFLSEEDKVLYQTINKFILSYNTQPTSDSLLIEIDSRNGLRDDVVKSIKNTIQSFGNDKEATNLNWLVDSTEKFCQEKGIRSEDHTSELHTPLIN